MDIIGASVVRDGNGPDYVYLKTNLPCGIWPYKGFATLKLDLAAGSAEKYMSQHFPSVRFEVIDLRKKHPYDF